MIPNTSPEFMEGARACLEALRHASQIVAAGNGSGQTTEEYYRKRDAAVASILQAAGPLPPRAAGALATLAEFMVALDQDGSWDDLDEWVPESTMLPDERASRRTAFAAECEELNRAPSNVVPFAR